MHEAPEGEEDAEDHGGDGFGVVCAACETWLMGFTIEGGVEKRVRRRWLYVRWRKAAWTSADSMYARMRCDRSRSVEMCVGEDADGSIKVW